MRTIDTSACRRRTRTPHQGATWRLVVDALSLVSPADGAHTLAHRPPDPGPVGRYRPNCGSSDDSSRTASTAPPSRRPGPDSASTTSWSPICTSAHRSLSVGKANRAARFAFSDKPKVRNFGSLQMRNLRSLPTASADHRPGSAAHVCSSPLPVNPVAIAEPSKYSTPSPAFQVEPPRLSPYRPPFPGVRY